MNALALAALLAQATPTIDIVGERAETRVVPRPGRSLVMRPEDASRFDSATLLKRETSLTVPETGRVSAAGFAVPRVRGQDARLTEIYVEDELLQDPYSGLPLVDELDVRAFGELAVHLGATPVDLATVNPVGTIRYRIRPLAEDQAVVGTTVGKPYGSSAWTLAGAASDDSTAQGRVYLRGHQTTGRFAHHDDQGTPYNSADDTTETRANNDRRSTQTLPMLSWRTDGWSVTGFGLVSDATSGLPAPGVGNGGHARQSTKGRLATIKAESKLGYIAKVHARVTTRADGRTTDDPRGLILGNRRQAALDVVGRKVAVGTTWDDGAIFGKAEALAETTTVETTSDHARELRVERRGTGGYAGLGVRTGDDTLLELKARGVGLRDHAREGLGDPVLGADHEKRDHMIAGGSAALSMDVVGVLVYAQIARHARPPTLLEEFGDGGRIRGSSTLDSETVRHGELGASLGAGETWRAGMSTFQDDVSDRIVIVPVLADTLRAENLETTRVQGVEAQTEAKLGATRLGLGLTRLVPRDLTAGGRRVLPGVAERHAALFVEHAASVATLRATSRYQSQVYRDLGNSIVIPEFWVHDLGVDRTLTALGRRLDLGLAVLNVTDVRRLPVSAPATSANEGQTAYSDVDGYPLPGRQWRLSAAAWF